MATYAVSDIFPTVTCSRCGGTGNYSFCEMYGTTCFKCHGAGKVYSKQVEVVVAELNRAIKEQKEKSAGKLEPGDMVWTTKTILPGGRVRWSDAKKVVAVNVDKSRPCAWSGVDLVESGWAATIVFEDGSTQQTRTNETIRTKSKGVDWRPYAERLGLNLDEIQARIDAKNAAKVAA